ncbi:unnamed protein product [Caenorhabditis angaria]|uniref:C3H1-type domain-containing protein n=1 Tax=Caenorhabditis angaria TaxID=860376 RepID=A0A9P1ILC6_9PELO|nr:unnamed protein product [Caenorhabditis angaria]
MVDVITKNEAEEFEDGELPEDGEICDDEDEEQINTQVSKQSPLPHSSTSEATVSSSGSQRENRERERGDREREREKERDRERERNGRDRRNRRSDEQVHRDLDPFGPGKEEMDYEGNDNGTGGYGNQSAAGPEEYNDVDYRVNRRRRHSPMAASSSSADSPPHYSQYPAKRPAPHHNSYYNSRPASYRGGLGGAGAHPSTRYPPQTTPRFNTEKQICKFFREGYCRDGDRCCYSHNTEDSLRRPILCNFYANSYCKKGLQCLMLHGEYPCKSFNQNNGVCDNLEQCKYSHLPLTEYTRPLYEASLSEDHPLSHPPYRPLPPPPPNPAAMAPMPSRRKVLLPGGPANLQASPPSAIHAAIPQSINGGQLPPPSIVVPTKYPTTGFFNSGLPPVRNIEPPRPVISEILQPQPMPVQPKPQQAFNIEDMLNKLASGSSLTEDDSPASPPPLFPPVSSTSSISILPTSSFSTSNRLVTWRLIKCIRPAAYSGVENIELLASNDPRKARALSAQFDAFSNRLCSSNSNSSAGGDPRLPQSLMKKIDENVTSSWMPQMS